MTAETEESQHDPREILTAWLAGNYVRADGQIVMGRTWDDDTRYRYEQAMDSWLEYIGDLVWQAQPLHISDWASRIRNLDGSVMSDAGRGRAASAIRSFYRHCEDDLGADGWHFPRRARLVGPVRPKKPQVRYTPHQMDALRTAADRYSGPGAERSRLAVYLCMAGLRPGQATGLWLQHIHRDDQNAPTWRLPAKNNNGDAVASLAEIPRPILWALDEYLPVRAYRPPTSTETTGPLLTSRYGKPLDVVVTFPRMVRTVAMSHPDLEELAAGLSPDGVAHSPSPFS